jgi:hypothetical protein
MGRAPDDLEPDAAVPPASLKEAIEKANTLRGLARRRRDNEIVADLVSHAAPDKVFGYLRGATLTWSGQAWRILGETVQWLSERNVEASTESETVTRNRTEMNRRVWHDGTARRQFEMHLKPNESTHPDQCVRIYFDWDEPSRQVIVGWVGRHP